VAPGSVRLCCGVISRGIALYEGKVIVPVVDGHLVALDAASGKVLWSVVAIPKENSQNYSLTMAPRVYKGKILIGTAGAEFAPFRGYLAAFDVNNGKELWRFYTVPGDPSKPFENKAMEVAAKTWSGEWWKYGYGMAWPTIRTPSWSMSGQATVFRGRRRFDKERDPNVLTICTSTRSLQST
ncbi:MAG: hypothetical protein DMG14_30735, partial [Acidobacteria bacterium]